MRKTAYILAASALMTVTAAMAQEPAAASRARGTSVTNMAGAPAAEPVANARVLMLRTFVSDLDRATKFYQAVFGMTAIAMPGFGGPRPGAAPGTAPAGRGGGIRILNFPGGSPGMIMIKGSGDATMMRGSYVIQVANLQAALAAAEANGGKVQTTRFTAGAQESRHVLDPDGNDLEILQSGPPPRKAG